MWKYIFSDIKFIFFVSSMWRERKCIAALPYSLLTCATEKQQTNINRLLLRYFMYFCFAFFLLIIYWGLNWIKNLFFVSPRLLQTMKKKFCNNKNTNKNRIFSLVSLWNKLFQLCKWRRNFLCAKFSLNEFLNSNVTV